jgi:hypothetical protein
MNKDILPVPINEKVLLHISYYPPITHREYIKRFFIDMEYVPYRVMSYHITQSGFYVKLEPLFCSRYKLSLFEQNFYSAYKVEKWTLRIPASALVEAESKLFSDSYSNRRGKQIVKLIDERSSKND